MTSGKKPEDLFLDNLELIERVIAYVRRRSCMSEEEGEELASEVRLKLVEDDYAVLRKFEGKSSLRTYLTVVVQRLALDFRTARWGKWRPSAAAKRLGTVALHLERLLARDGHGFEEACEILRRNHGVKQSVTELAEIAGQLPARSSRRFEGEDALAGAVAAGLRPDEALLDGEERDRHEAACYQLGRALKLLAAEDRLVLRMLYEDDCKVVDIARALHLDQKQLYRRIDKLRRTLKSDLEKRGVTGSRQPRSSLGRGP